METHHLMETKWVLVLCGIALSIGAILAGAIMWTLGRSYGATETETKWLRVDAEKHVAISGIPEIPRYEVFDKKVKAKLRKSAKK